MWFDILKANKENHLVFLIDVFKVAYLKKYIETLESKIGATYAVEEWREEAAKEMLPKAKAHLSSLNIEDYTDELYLNNPLPTYFELRMGRDYGDKLSNNIIKRFVKEFSSYPRWMYREREYEILTPREVEMEGAMKAIDLYQLMPK